MSSFWLEYTQDGQQKQFSFDSVQVTVGRDKSADFVLDHPTVSRQHAMIRADQAGHQLVVLSQGGLTAIDGGQVQGAMQLYDGSEIHFGQLSFTFRSHSAPPKPAAAGWQQGAPDGAQPQQPQQPQQPEGGWGAAQWDKPAAAPELDLADGGGMSWDQIAASADDLDAADRPGGMSDFQRIQAAQAKADKQTRGNNPLIIYGGIIGIVGVMAFAFWPKPPAEPLGGVVDIDKQEQPFIKWEKRDIDCVGRANCRAMALDAFKVGKNLVEQAGADITNPYESYKQFDRARLMLETGGIDPVPVEMAEMANMQLSVKVGLDETFQRARLNYRNFEKRKMYKKMASELTKLQAYFPDKRSLYNQWAVAKEREMKDNQVYPAATLY